MKTSEENIKNEYRHNKRFRDYVDRYCNKHKISIDEALTHSFVKLAYLHYTDT